MTPYEQKAFIQLQTALDKLEQMKETAKRVSEVESQNQKFFTALSNMKQIHDYAFTLVNTLQVLERDKDTINKLKNLLKP